MKRPTEGLSCEEALRLLAAHLDRELEPASAGQMMQHLEVCRSCYSRAEFEAKLKARLAALAAEPVSPALAHRVHSLIRNFTVAGGA